MGPVLMGGGAMEKTSYRSNPTFPETRVAQVIHLFRAVPNSEAASAVRCPVPAANPLPRRTASHGEDRRKGVHRTAIAPLATRGRAWTPQRGPRAKAQDGGSGVQPQPLRTAAHSSAKPNAKAARTDRWSHS